MDITKHRLNSNCDRCLKWGKGNQFVCGEGQSFVDFYGGAIQLKITNIDSDGLLSSK